MNTLMKPCITEKSLSLAARGWYTFVVRPDARKKEITRDVSEFYKVTVTGIRTVHMHGKTRRVGKKTTYVKKPDWKKAIVHLASGQKIDAFEVTTQEAEKSTQGGSAGGGK
jgi:large subunit ribosomal protein L23